MILFKNKSNVAIATIFLTLGMSSSAIAYELNTPNLRTPKNGKELNRATFRWTKVRNADAYRIVISQRADFAGYTENGGQSRCDGTCYTTATKKTRYSVNHFNLKGKTYYWKVRAGGSHGMSDWSPVFSFKTKGSSKRKNNRNHSSGYRLPFNGRYGVSQGNNGSTSHTGKAKYAYDFPMPVGTPVVAMAPGEIKMTESRFGRGACDKAYANKANYVVIKHDNGKTSLYLHLSKVMRKSGRVQAGDVIGLSGQSGYACGAHLHVQLQKDCGSWWCRSVRLRFN